MSKRILCFGDSNTWGTDAEGGGRFPSGVRWTGILKGLRPEDEIIEEGLGGRTTVWDDPIEGVHKNGKSYLIPCLESHKPLDMVIIMLGTNDLKKRFSLSAYDIAAGAGELIRLCQTHLIGSQPAPKVLLISPIHVGDDIRTSGLNEMFGYENSIDVSKKFSHYYRKIADQYGCDFLDAATVVTATPVDSIHMDEKGHRDLGEAVAKKLTEIYPDSVQHEEVS